MRPLFLIWALSVPALAQLKPVTPEELDPVRKDAADSFVTADKPIDNPGIVNPLQLLRRRAASPRTDEQVRRDVEELTAAIEVVRELQKGPVLPAGLTAAPPITDQQLELMAARVEGVCRTLRVDAGRCQQARTLYVSRWQGDRKGLTQADVIKRDAQAQAAFARAQQRQADARTAAGRINPHAFATPQDPGATRVTGQATTGRADVLVTGDQTLDLKRQTGAQTVATGDVPLNEWQKSVLGRETEHIDRGQANFEAGEKAWKEGRYGAAVVHKTAAAGDAIWTGVHRLVRGDPQTMKDAAVGAATGVTLVAAPAAIPGWTARVAGATGIFGRTAAIASPVAPGLTAHGTLSSVGDIVQDPSLANGVLAVADVAGGPVTTGAKKVATVLGLGGDAVSQGRMAMAATDDLRALEKTAVKQTPSPTAAAALDDLDFTAPPRPVQTAAPRPIVTAGDVSSYQPVTLADGKQLNLANKLGEGNSGTVFAVMGPNGKPTGEVIKIPNSAASARDLALEVQNAERIKAAGIHGVDIRNMPTDGTPPSYLIKERLPDIKDLDAGVVRVANGGTYTEAQQASLRDIYTRLERYNMGRPPHERLNVDLSPANLYWDARRNQFRLIENAPPTVNGSLVDTRWIGDAGRRNFRETYGIEL